MSNSTPARIDWRMAILAGLAVGLAGSPLIPTPLNPRTAGALVAGSAALIALRPSGDGHGRATWLSLLLLCGLVAGACLGAVRLDAIDDGALRGATGDSRDLRGYVVAVPRRSNGEVRVAVESGAGRVLVQAPEPVAELRIGTEVEVGGELALPPPWYRSTLERQGIAQILETGRIEPTGARRAGLRGRLDSIRDRAEDALGEGMPPREAALARGFVLGQDDSIDPQTVEDFRRAGLSHLLAVSGQNVVLLALLAAPLLALLGLGLRARLLWLLAVIALYVPLAGAGPSIQRAGVMGAAALLATMAGRPASRAYALLAAAAVTLALNPRALGDPGWQLSFAAVSGIFALSQPLRATLFGRIGQGAFGRAIGEGAALTIAATIATAPLIATHFGTLSVASLAANLLALPAVAPAMWLGMITAALGQIPAVPVEPLNGLNAVLLGYIAQVAAWLGRPSWASVELGPPGPGTLVGVYALLGLVAALVLRRAARVRASAPKRPASELGAGSARARVPALAAAAAAALAAAALLFVGGEDPESPVSGLRVTVIDVGQGDAILLQPPHAPAVLVDGGPPGDGIEADLIDAGVESLGAAVITHDQSDHVGGIVDLLGRLPVRRVAFAFASRSVLARARASGAALERVGEGSELRSGALRLEVIWPPRALLGGLGGEDPNARALVILARWRTFSMLLTADAEAEAVPIDSGPIDVLKVAHHGSEDAGLDELLDHAAPSLAVISVGADNSYGHPTDPTLHALADHGVPVMRTDEDGSIVLDVGPSGFTVTPSG